MEHLRLRIEETKAELAKTEAACKELRKRLSAYERDLEVYEQSRDAGKQLMLMLDGLKDAGVPDVLAMDILKQSAGLVK